MNGASFNSLKAESALVRSLSSKLAHEIGKSIATGQHVPGSLIEDEGALVRRFGVSRTVVRDAVKVLVGKGLLEVRRGIGTRVRPREEWALLDDDVLAWQLSVPADSDRLLQLIEVRQLFEPRAAAWAAQRATVAERAAMRDAIEVMYSSVADPDRFLVAEAGFHRTVLRAARNEFLLALSGIIYSSLLSSTSMTHPDVRTNRKSVSLHREVYNAITRQDETGAESGMKRLINHARYQIKSLIEVVT